MSNIIDEDQAYQQKLQAQIDQLEAEFAKIRAKSKELAADKKIEVDQLIDDLKDNLQQARQKLEKMLPDLD